MAGHNSNGRCTNGRRGRSLALACLTLTLGVDRQARRLPIGLRVCTLASCGEVLPKAAILVIAADLVRRGMPRAPPRLDPLPGPYLCKPPPAIPATGLHGQDSHSRQWARGGSHWGGTPPPPATTPGRREGGAPVGGARWPAAHDGAAQSTPCPQCRPRRPRRGHEDGCSVASPALLPSAQLLCCSRLPVRRQPPRNCKSRSSSSAPPRLPAQPRHPPSPLSQHNTPIADAACHAAPPPPCPHPLWPPPCVPHSLPVFVQRWKIMYSVCSLASGFCPRPHLLPPLPWHAPPPTRPPP